MISCIDKLFMFMWIQWLPIQAITHSSFDDDHLNEIASIQPEIEGEKTYIFSFASHGVLQ